MFPKKEDLEAMWKGLPDYVEGASSTICVSDSSGSMTARAGRKTTVTCLDVANALAIYFAEKCSGPFKDKYITFSKSPKFIDLSNCNSLHSKLATALSFSEIANTNIEAVFELILTTAVKNNVKQSEIPNILILSDMQFDYAVYSNNSRIEKRLFDQFAERYKEFGYNLPRICFWNICGRTVPLINNKLGVTLVSGFSPVNIKMVLSSKLDPFEALIEQLNVERYKPVEDSLKA